MYRHNYLRIGPTQALSVNVHERAWKADYVTVLPDVTSIGPHYDHCSKLSKFSFWYCMKICRNVDPSFAVAVTSVQTPNL